MTPEEQSWLKRLRLLQRGGDTCLFVLIASVALLSGSTYMNIDSKFVSVPLAVIAVFAMLGVLTSGMVFSGGLFREQNRRCPRCGENFFRWQWGIYVYTATRCFSCGYPTSDDLASLR